MRGRARIALGVGTAPRVELIHAGGSPGGFLHGCSRGVDAVSQWLVETSGLGPRNLAAWVKAGTGPSSCVSLRELSDAFPDLCARAFRTWNLVLYLVSLYLAVFVPGVWVLLTVSKIGFFGRGLLSWWQCLVQQWIHALRQYFEGFGKVYTFPTWRRTRFLKRCFSIRFEWRRGAQSMFRLQSGFALFALCFVGKSFHELSCMIRDWIFWGTCVSHRCRWCRSRREFTPR